MTFQDNRRPVLTVADLRTLDADEIVEGYRAGYAGEPCGDNRSRSFWHGWSNGRTDAGIEPKSVAAAELARAVLDDLSGPMGKI